MITIPVNLSWTFLINLPLRKGIRWYQKLAFEVLLGTTVVNCYIVYKNVTKAKISITKFREYRNKCKIKDQNLNFLACNAKNVIVCPVF